LLLSLARVQHVFEAASFRLDSDNYNEIELDSLTRRKPLDSRPEEKTPHRGFAR